MKLNDYYFGIEHIDLIDGQGLRETVSPLMLREDFIKWLTEEYKAQRREPNTFWATHSFFKVDMNKDIITRLLVGVIEETVYNFRFDEI